MSQTLWHLKNISLGAGTSRRLDDLSLDIPRGVTAVLGASGAGKSSLLNLLVAFEHPDTGTIDRSQANGLSEPSVFWVPQDYGLWPFLTVHEHLTAVTADTDRIDSMLDAFDLSELATAKPTVLSHGERSRLAVVRALMTGANVLVMDEPLSNVNPEQTLRYWDVVRDHITANDVNLIFATHSARTVLREAEHVFCMDNGALTYHGSVEELYSHPSTEQLAQVLGDANWLTTEEQVQWLGQAADDDLCYRPEQLIVEPQADSDVTLLSRRVHGPIAEVELQNQTGTRRFFCNAAGRCLAAGQGVALRVLCTLLVLLLAGACSRSEAPPLDISEQRTIPLPSNGPRVPAPRSIGTGPNEFAVLDDDGRVIVFSNDGGVIEQWRMPENDFGNPEGVCILRSGDIAVCDTHYSRVIIFTRGGSERLRIGRHGREPGEFIYPVAIAEDPEGYLYVGEYGSNDRIQKFTGDGVFVSQFGGFGTGTGEFQRPSGIVWLDGKIYVSDAFNNRIQVFTDGGEHLGTLPVDGSLQLGFPYDLAVAPDNSFYIVEYGSCRVTHIAADGRLLGRHGAAGMGKNQFQTPWGLGVDSAGRILVADTGNRRIVQLTPEHLTGSSLSLSSTVSTTSTYPAP